MPDSKGLKVPAPADDARSPERKPYTRPHLTDYGQLTHLTAGGSGSGKETSSAKFRRV